MQKLRAATISSNTGLIAALLALLVLLGSMQYYWLGEISAGERARMQSLVNSGVQRLGEDFDLEIASIFLGLQMQATTVRAQDWSAYAQRYEHWRAYTAHPDLVGDIYLVQMFENNTIKLMRFHRDTGRFVADDWPMSMQQLRQRFEQSLKTMHLENGLLVGNTPDPVADDVPALVIPVAQMSLLSDPQATYLDSEIVIGDRTLTRKPCPRCKPRPDPVFAYTVATFDLPYLWQHFVPSLVRKYFANGEVLDYNLAIVSRTDPTKLLYHSNTNTYETAPHSGDGQAYMFSLRLDEINRLLIDDTLRLSDLNDVGDRQSWRIAIGPSATSSSTASAITGYEGGRWQLFLTHRAGSLEAAVAQLQLKNMLVSSVILTLLGMSIVLMVRSSRRAQRLAQQKMEFVAAISHELRTPLAVICSAGENLADGVVPDPARARQYGAVIHSEGRRLAEMVDQALEFAGVQSGRKSYVLRPLGVRDLVQRAINACQAQIHDADVQIDLRVPDNLPLIMGDPVELTRALQNLIRNAIKYGGERRWVGIQVQPQVGARGSELSISIHDTGMGIAPEDIAHIFEPFYRSREAVAAQIHGSGLGLSLVRHIVEGHGGRVTVASTPGQGSVFTILLPCLSYDGRQPAVKPA